MYVISCANVASCIGCEGCVIARAGDDWKLDCSLADLRKFAHGTVSEFILTYVRVVHTYLDVYVIYDMI